MTLSGSMDGLLAIPPVITIVLMVILSRFMNFWWTIGIGGGIGLILYLIIEFGMVRPFRERLLASTLDSRSNDTAKHAPGKNE